jgi:hypothetical protein
MLKYVCIWGKQWIKPNGGLPDATAINYKFGITVYMYLHRVPVVPHQVSKYISINKY